MSVKCKYHGPTCENPVRCEEWKPRKYEDDGYEEKIDPTRLQVGHVLRPAYRSGSLPSFSDCVVLRFTVQYGRARRAKVGFEHMVCETLGEALGHAEENDFVVVKLARPYLFEDVGGPLMGFEQYEVYGKQLMDSYKVITMSTGAYDRRTVSFSTIYQEVREAEKLQSFKRREKEEG